MKRSFIFAALLCLFSLGANAQIKSVKLTASGLTCSMCSKAIFKHLQKLSVIQKLDVDVESSTYLISFKPDAKVSPDALKKAVEDAGFAVASLQMTASFPRLEVAAGAPVPYGGAYYRILNTSGSQVLEGERTFTVVDKGFLAPADYKKFSAAAGVKAPVEGRVYNVIL